MTFDCIPGFVQGNMGGETPGESWAHHVWITWVKPSDTITISGATGPYSMPSWFYALDSDDSRITYPKLSNDTPYLVSDLVSRGSSSFNNLYYIIYFDGGMLWYVWFYVSEYPAPWSPPASAFMGSPLIGDFPLTVQFTDESTLEPNEWLWDFGDGFFSVEQNPIHEYADAGLYTVSLRSSNAGGSDLERKPNYIHVTGDFPHFHPQWSIRIGPD